VESTLGTDLAGAKQTLAQLGDLGISLTAVTDKLLEEGVDAFAKSFDTLLAAVKSKRTAVDAGDRANFAEAADSVASHARDWAAKVARIWAKDASVWTGHDEGKWLGWLTAVEQGRAQLAQLAALRRRREEGGPPARDRPRHGRLVAVPVGVRANVRHRDRRAEAPRARLDPPRAGARRRTGDRPQVDAVHRQLEVRLDHGAERDARVLPRPRAQRGRV